ncbi:glutamine cyclotransferase [Bacteroidia bacterium]|nr:glutamine cyclotransferase [Bacteroidia bacterium]
MMTKNIIPIISILLLGCACKQPAKTTEMIVQKQIPTFNADSAYTYTVNQVAFGPRVPNTAAHRACGNYLAAELKRFGANVIEQEATLYTYKRQAIQAKNIIASFAPELKNRILLCAHWDSRPFADHDPDPKNHHQAIDGANDGAGACGVLLEIARQTGLQSPEIGIDIVLFDAEDWGTPEFDRDRYGSTGWCLGSEYWAKNPHTPNYTAQFGILLDMVSAPNAQFYQEYFSMQTAGNIVRKVWNAAQALGYNDYFINQSGGQVEDDHRNVMRFRHIPCIDIIQYNPNNDGFGDYWHTVNDNIENVSRETMQAVGQTLLYVIYQ